MSIILVIREAEIWRIIVQRQLGQKVGKIPSQPIRQGPVTPAMQEDHSPGQKVTSHPKNK
jgi:hypothetical protein